MTGIFIFAMLADLVFLVLLGCELSFSWFEKLFGNSGEERESEEDL